MAFTIVVLPCQVVGLTQDSLQSIGLHHHENTSVLRSFITQNPDRIVRYSRQMDLLRLVLANLVLESNHIHHVPIPYTVHTLLDVNAAY